MKTYRDNKYQYFFDTNIKMWTLYKIDLSGNQIGDAFYYANKHQLIVNHPELKFTYYEN